MSQKLSGKRWRRNNIPRWNYVARKKTTKPRKPSIEVQRERVNKVLDVIMERKEIRDYDLQKVMDWGMGIHERIMRIIKSEYSDMVEWNKKTRIWRNIPLDPNKPISEQVISIPLETI